ncbi:FtsH protease regulator HflC [Buchnera aphidicola str. Ak (Acyrthosiphon kondoi)]|uniref:Protein HflC n=1 Tax=Buchnera aphidicola str. Ak (Acyrthosiphon kondoi) TaxID=1005090 RepID=G2LM50_9GAMM|nr:protease modulator HflC [Buchnera aphidicola]AEO08897.1 FtsH protease regulator HflC [Buchnera aphidicola str. Ak (Acyrthosiphon kondoi)]
MNKIFIFMSSIFFLFLSSSFFIVKEGECGIVLQFGKVLRNNEQKIVVYNPGLHFKLPFLETVKMLDRRIHTMDNQADRFVTKEKKDLIIDSYIKWRINDFSRYYLATGGGDVFQAEVLLKRKFNDRLRSEIGCLDVKEIITDSRGKLTTDVLHSLNKGTVNLEKNSLEKNSLEKNSLEKNSLEKNSLEKNSLEKKSLEKNSLEKNSLEKNSLEKKSLEKNSLTMNINSMNALGIQVVDVRIKQINLPIEISEAIYNRMRAEREAVARSQRSQGQEQAEKLRATADYKVSIILAEAQKKALIIKSQGEAEVTKLFAENFSKEPDFYFFIRSLRAYENSFKNNGNIILIDSDNDFFQYMNKMIDIESR